MPKVTQLGSGIAGIGTQACLTLKTVPALSTTMCFRQNKIIAILKVFIVVEKQEGVFNVSKEKSDNVTGPSLK